VVVAKGQNGVGVSERARVVNGRKRAERTVSRWWVKRAGVCGLIGDGILFEETDLCVEAMSRTRTGIDQRCNGLQSAPDRVGMQDLGARGDL
jgi:hypothetical protein